MRFLLFWLLTLFFPWHWLGPEGEFFRPLAIGFASYFLVSAAWRRWRTRLLRNRILGTIESLQERRKAAAEAAVAAAASAGDLLRMVVVNASVPNQRIPLASPGVTSIAVVDPVTGELLQELVVEVELPVHAGPDPRKL